MNRRSVASYLGAGRPAYSGQPGNSPNPPKGRPSALPETPAPPRGFRLSGRRAIWPRHPARERAGLQRVRRDALCEGGLGGTPQKPFSFLLGWGAPERSFSPPASGSAEGGTPFARGAWREPPHRKPLLFSLGVGRAGAPPLSPCLRECRGRDALRKAGVEGTPHRNPLLFFFAWGGARRSVASVAIPHRGDPIHRTPSELLPPYAPPHPVARTCGG